MADTSFVAGASKGDSLLCKIDDGCKIENHNFEKPESPTRVLKLKDEEIFYKYIWKLREKRKEENLENWSLKNGVKSDKKFKLKFFRRFIRLRSGGARILPFVSGK